jgi:hypothetical protein
MSDHDATCGRCDEQLAAYLEDELGREARAAFERHLAASAPCRLLVDDLRRLTSDAAALPPLRPTRDLWAGVASRIEAPVVDLGRHDARLTHVDPRRWSRWSVAAAAAALVAVTAGVTPAVTFRTAAAPAQVAVASPSAEPPATAASAGAPAPSTAIAAAPGAAKDRANEPTAAATRAAPARPRGGATLVAGRAPRVAAEAVYAQEITALRAALDQRRGELDSATVAILERNLGVIDAAIQESRAALARDPRSPFLGDQLSRALDRKVHLLRRAAALPART